jgi:hypothetical protein
MLLDVIILIQFLVFRNNPGPNDIHLGDVKKKASDERYILGGDTEEEQSEEENPEENDRL